MKPFVLSAVVAIAGFILGPLLLHHALVSVRVAGAVGALFLRELNFWRLRHELRPQRALNTNPTPRAHLFVLQPMSRRPNFDLSSVLRRA